MTDVAAVRSRGGARRVSTRAHSSLHARSLRPRRGETPAGGAEGLLRHGGRRHLVLLLLLVHRHGHHGDAAADGDAHADERAVQVRRDAGHLRHAVGARVRVG